MGEGPFCGLSFVLLEKRKNVIMNKYTITYNTEKQVEK